MHELRYILEQLAQMIALMSVGLFIGNLIEAMHWTRFLARLARPLARLGRLGDISAASFAVAFVSGVSANTMLAEAYDQGRLSRRELVLSNLFNSLPTYFLHLPTTACIVAPLLKSASTAYLGVTIGAAVLRSACILVVSRVVLRGQQQTGMSAMPDTPEFSLKLALQKTWERFQRRIKKIMAMTVPIYLVIHLLHKQGLFSAAEHFLAAHLHISWLHPKAMSILVFQLAAEFSAGMAAAGALLDADSMPVRDVVIALIAGNVLSSPMRAFRHQFPYYAGIFKPALALELILCSQGLRVLSLIACGILYYWSV